MNVFEIKCLISMMMVKRWDRVRNDNIRRRVEKEENNAEKVDRRVLRWFGLV